MPDYSPHVPIYLQIIDKVKHLIVSGWWPPGQRIPAVRDLAAEFQVNPNTMQRALAELEREGLLFSERTSGRYVTQDESRISAVRKILAEGIMEAAKRGMTELGYSAEERKVILKDLIE